MITIKKSEEIEKINEGGSILASVVDQVLKHAKPGVSAFVLDQLADRLINEAGGRPSFKDYKRYPAAACISINDELVHSIPRKDSLLKDGDILSVDIGLEYKKLFTDMAKTIAIGTISKQAKKLIKVTAKSLDIAISQVKPGNTTGDIGHAVQQYVEHQGFSIVRSLVGHGVGYAVHEDPRIPNFGDGGTGAMLKEGMVIAIEPMVNIGGYEVITKKDGWTIATADGSLCAHFEHTVVVTGHGAKILTI